MSHAFPRLLCVRVNQRESDRGARGLHSSGNVTVHTPLLDGRYSGNLSMGTLCSLSSGDLARFSPLPLPRPVIVKIFPRQQLKKARPLSLGTRWISGARAEQEPKKNSLLGTLPVREPPISNWEVPRVSDAWG
jgi:hypothetical protein